nr:RNA binding protein EWS [Hymenolepis microstoma]
MADQYQYGGIPQPGQTPSYTQFSQYPNAGGDQGAQFIPNYALPQGNPQAAVFGQPSFNPSPYPPAGAAMTVPQLGGQLNPAQLAGAGFSYGDYSQFNPYGQNAGLQPHMNDMQQFSQLLPNLNQSAVRNMYEALAQDRALSGFNTGAFIQDSPNVGGFPNKAFGGHQRGMNNFENGNRSNNLPSVTNPDGLREDTIFVSKLPQNIDHETMKAQFGTVGKIKMNAKSGMPMIWIFKERGIPKGDALVTYEDPLCVQKAIKYFSENDFMGKKIEVKQAKNSQRPVIIPSSGQQNSTAQGNGRNNNEMSSFCGNQSMDMYGGQFNSRNDAPSMPGSARNSGQMRGIGGRDQCNPCGAPRPDDGMMAGSGMMMMPGAGGPPQPQRGVMLPQASHPQMMGNGGSIMPPRGPPPLRMGAAPQQRGSMPPPMRGGVLGRGIVGGPMRGSSINAGRNMRTNPY